jgi:hypothetical protein
MKTGAGEARLLAWERHEHMTDWDARAEELAREQAAVQERQRREWQAKERAKKEQEEADTARLLDVTEWAIARYRAACIPLLPIYVEWEETIKPFLKKARKEGRRQQIGEVYPLRRYYREHEGSGEYGSSYTSYNIWVADANKQIYDIGLGQSDTFKWPNVTEIIGKRKTGSQDDSRIEAYLTRQGPPFSGDFPGNYDRWLDVDVVCDEIVKYVTAHTNPDQPPEYFLVNLVK